jgi:hypothetical protein
LEISDFQISIRPDLSTFFNTKLLVKLIIIYFRKHYNGVSMFLKTGGGKEKETGKSGEEKMEERKRGCARISPGRGETLAYI